MESPSLVFPLYNDHSILADATSNSHPSNKQSYNSKSGIPELVPEPSANFDNGLNGSNTKLDIIFPVDRYIDVYDSIGLGVADEVVLGDFGDGVILVNSISKSTNTTGQQLLPMQMPFYHEFTSGNDCRDHLTLTDLLTDPIVGPSIAMQPAEYENTQTFTEEDIEKYFFGDWELCKLHMSV